VLTKVSAADFDTVWKTGASILVSDTPPPLTANQLWWNSSTGLGGGQLMLAFQDINTIQWVPAAPNVNTASSTPTGAIMDFAGSTAPVGWLICNGAVLSRNTFPNLFGVIGTAYGAGDGATTFALPDLRGRVIAMLDTAGTVLPGYTTMGATGGAASVVLTAAQMPTHLHGLKAGPGGNLNAPGSSAGISLDGPSGAWFANTDIAGNNNAHSNVQPTMVMNKIIKT
jgi:microcystin-dependent protein